MQTTSIEMRQLGTSDLKVTAITFGAWAIGEWMWGEQDDEDARTAIRTALDHGMTTIDTAAVYGFGRSEELVAEAIEGRRDEVQLLTKFGLRWDSDQGEPFMETTGLDGSPVRLYKNSRPDSIVEECERSLRRLKTDRIDLYQCHWRDKTTAVDATMEALAKLMEQGKVRAVGVSNYTVEEVEQAAKVVELASVQPPYSMVNRGIEEDLLPYCIEHGIGVLPYSPLQRGLLTGKITMDYEFDEGDHRADNAYFKPVNRKRVLGFLDKIRPIAEAHDATLAQLVINWTIHRQGITSALVGARNEKQARENAQAAGFTLTEDETATINGHLDELELEL